MGNDFNKNMQEAFNEVAKDFALREKEKKKAWKKALKGEMPVIITKSNEHFGWCLGYEVKPFTYKLNKEDFAPQNRYLARGNVLPRESLSIEALGFLARSLEEIRKERKKLIQKEQRLLKSFFNKGKNIGLDNKIGGAV